METKVQTIDDTITSKFEKDHKKAVKKMAKSGFVSVDGVICQYAPGNNTFAKIGAGYCNGVYNHILHSLGNYWGILTMVDVTNLLKNELPNITENDAKDFKKYLEQSKVVINEKSIKDLMKKAIQDNDTFKNQDADLKGKLNLQSELMVLRNNDIYSDGDFNLFKLEDGKFKRYTANDVFTLFRSTIGTENTKLVLQYVKNHWRTYADSLTNVKLLVDKIKEKEFKETTLNMSEPGFKNVLEIISNYGGK